MKNDFPSKQKLMQRVQMASFSVVETALYLDTHPYDREALKALRKYCEEKESAVLEYEDAYGPLTCCAAVSDDWYKDEPERRVTGKPYASAYRHDPRYDWVASPWPWELEDA